jgi:hypothetical protein
VQSPKKFNVHLYQKVPFVFSCFQASAAPRPENSASEEKDALFGLDTQITITVIFFVKKIIQYKLQKRDAFDHVLLSHLTF